MPGLVRKLVVFAATDGLILQPVHQRNQRPLHIDYKTHKISAATRPSNKDDASFECHGIVGLLTVAPLSYLVAVSGRQQIAQIRGAPIYVVTDVTLIPLSTQAEANGVIKQAKDALKKGSSGPEAASSDSEVSDDEGTHSAGVVPSDDDHPSPATASPADDAPTEARPQAPTRSSSNVAQDVIGMKGQYGRFAERWFSRKGWSAERRRAQGMSLDDARGGSEPTSQPAPPQEPPGAAEVSTQGLDRADGGTKGPLPPDPSGQQAESPGQSSLNTFTLLPKLLRTTRMLLASRSFFFAYDLDITRRLGTDDSQGSDVPLCKSVDPLFFWNHILSDPLVDGGHSQFVLPLMQGFVGQRTFRVHKRPASDADAIRPSAELSENAANTAGEPEPPDTGTDFLLTVISRRSTMRPGLRYLRRGVDDEGHAANSVETEQILSRASWAPSERVHSFTQIRGSIPLFFSQSPYSFKPVPVLQHSTATNQSAFRRHFHNIAGRYGDCHVVLLVDKAGGEKAIGEKYEAYTQQVNEAGGISDRQLGFEWFDFHNICRGMKFENVDLLMKTLGDQMDAFGTTVEVNGNLQRRQSGVARTNCMDCLDRTNVVQSAFGQRALEQQLRQEGYEVDLRMDKSTQWFNTLWADNGDAISKQYSSTAALKGDYTRTRQRNYRGAINDLGLTLSRYYNNIVNDYFSQAAIDYLLGNATAQVFEDFEQNMMSRDPSMSMQKVRENAISTSSKIVIEDSSEDFVGGWTLLSPREPNTVKTLPLEEAVLLVTDAALYRVRFDWSDEKVSSFERVELRSIAGILKGTYITSALTSAQCDEARNVGFVVKYRPGKEDIARVNTRSLSSAIGLDGSSAGPGYDLEDAAGVKGKKNDASALKVLAFKALPTQSSITGDGREPPTVSERQVVSNVCDEIRRTALGSSRQGWTAFVEEKDIISLQEARKSTGLVEQWGHSLKHMVWG